MFSDVQSNLYNGVLDGNIGSKAKKIRYKVILKGIDGKRETKDAFAIKLSLLAKVPVTRTRFLIKNTPSVVWKGFSEKKAQRLLSIIEESGGKGTITEGEMKPVRTEESSGKAGAKKVCLKCGFPLSEDDKFCSFCATSVDTVSQKSDKKKTIYKGTKSHIPKGRMFFYLIIVVGLVLFALLSS